VSVILFPVISAMVTSGARAEVASLVDRSVRYLTLLTLPLIAILAFFPLPIIRVALSDQFAGDTLTLSLLAAWAFFLVVSRPHLNLVLGHGHSRIAARVGIAQSVCVIVLNLLLVPNDIKSLGIKLAGLKAVGAALATLASGVLGYAMLRWYSWRLEGYRQRAPFWRPALAAAIMVAALWALDRWTSFHLQRWYSLVAYSILGLLVYAAALVALRELTRADLAFVRDTLSPSEMARYLRGELLRRDE
jgi:O-antigen/teichoic acid export membrane protein